tara:strand:+ start:58 stop:549 length:492 start_codon:yes stop_codon:yes gene_type:complete
MNKIIIIILIAFVLMNISPIIKYLNKILKKLPTGVKYLIPIILLIILINNKTESFSQENLSIYDTILKSIGYDHDTYYGVTSKPPEHTHHIDPKYSHKHHGLKKNNYGFVRHTHSLEEQDIHTPLNSLRTLSDAQALMDHNRTKKTAAAASEIVTPEPEAFIF